MTRGALTLGLAALIGAFTFTRSATVDRRMEVINIDSSKAETRLGADLIYYHVNTESFVLVQYKRLRQKLVQVDDRFCDQMARMGKLAAFNRKAKEPDE